MPRAASISMVSLSTRISSTSSADFSGTKSMRRSRSSSWSLSEMPRTGPRWMRRIRWVVKPATLLRRRFEGRIETYSSTFLLVWKSRVMREAISPAADRCARRRHGVDMISLAILHLAASTQTNMHAIKNRIASQIIVLFLFGK